MTGLHAVAMVAWHHAGVERVRFVVGHDGHWITGLGGPLITAVESAADTTDLFSRLVLALDPFGLDPVEVGETRRTLTIELRPVQKA